jgi:hypothetical protein
LDEEEDDDLPPEFPLPALFPRLLPEFPERLELLPPFPDLLPEELLRPCEPEFDLGMLLYI